MNPITAFLIPSSMVDSLNPSATSLALALATKEIHGSDAIQPKVAT